MRFRKTDIYARLDPTSNCSLASHLMVLCGLERRNPPCPFSFLKFSNTAWGLARKCILETIENYRVIFLSQ